MQNLDTIAGPEPKFQKTKTVPLSIEDSQSDLMTESKMSESISKSKTMTKQTSRIGSSSQVGFEIIAEEEEHDTPVV